MTTTTTVPVSAWRWYLPLQEGAWRPLVVGLLLGTAAATAGVVPLFAGARPSHILVIAALVVALTDREARRLTALRPRALEIGFLVVIVSAVAVEALNASQLHFTPGWSTAAASIWFLLAGIAARLVARDEDSLDPFLASLVLPGIVTAVFAVLQAVIPRYMLWTTMIAPSAAFDARVESDRLARATWFVGHWTGGAYLGCALIVALVTLLILRRATRAGSAIMTIGLVLLTSGVLASAVLAPTITALVILALGWFLVGMRWRQLVAFVVALPAMYWLLGGGIANRVALQSRPGTSTPGIEVPAATPNTIAYRIHIWFTETIPAILQRPWSGWGTDVYADEPEPGRMLPAILEWGSAESQWGWLLVTFGLIVTLLFLALLVLVGVEILRLLRRRPRLALPLAVFFAFALAGSMLVSLFTNRGFPLAFWPFAFAMFAVYGGREPASRR
jgi:hypothetical protein